MKKTIVMVFAILMMMLTPTDSGAGNSSIESSGLVLRFDDDADVAELMSPHFARMLIAGVKSVTKPTNQRDKPGVACHPTATYSSCLSGKSKNPSSSSPYCLDPTNRSPECHH